MRLLEPSRIRPIVDLGPDVMPHGVVDRVAENRRGDQYCGEHVDVEVRGGDGTGAGVGELERLRLEGLPGGESG